MHGGVGGICVCVPMRRVVMAVLRCCQMKIDFFFFIFVKKCMSVTFDNILLIGSFLVIASVFASKSNRFGVPSLLLFLIVGVLAGSEGIGHIHFKDFGVAKFIGNIAMVLILFSGGLDTHVSSFRKVLWQGVLLSTIGVLLTAGLVGIFVWAITPMPMTCCLLLGCIVSSTDASTVFSVLRSKGTELKGHIRSLLELESGSNDPMAFFLTIFMIDVANGVISFEDAWFDGFTMFISQFAIGILIGLLMGYMMLKVTNRIHLDVQGLYSVLELAFAIFTYAIATFFDGNGFLAVYIAAIFLGNNNFVHKKSIIKHFDGQAWLMQIIMFITLGLLLSPCQMWYSLGVGLLIFLFLLLVARPISVFLLLIRSRFNIQSQTFISWVGLRGAVSIVFAIYAVDARVPYYELIFSFASLIAILSVALQGTTIPYVAKLLKLKAPMRMKFDSKIDETLVQRVKMISLDVEINKNHFCCGKSIVEVGFPDGLTINLIERNKTFIEPDGETVLVAGDKITIVADSIDTLQKFSSLIETYK